MRLNGLIAVTGGMALIAYFSIPIAVGVVFVILGIGMYAYAVFGNLFEFEDRSI